MAKKNVNPVQPTAKTETAKPNAKYRPDESARQSILLDLQHDQKIIAAHNLDEMANAFLGESKRQPQSLHDFIREAVSDACTTLPGSEKELLSSTMKVVAIRANAASDAIRDYVSETF